MPKALSLAPRVLPSALAVLSAALLLPTRGAAEDAAADPAVGQAASGQSAAAQSTPGQPASGQSSSEAQPQGLQEVVVTAQKRAENLQQVPIAITAVSGERLADLGVATTQDLASASPGVLITEFGQADNAMAIYIRGIGQLDFAEHQESPVALYIDGAYVSFQGAANLGLYDLQQLSILRGPQGTLFGRNANGGVVQITTNKPSDTFSAYFQEEVGSYGQVNSEGAIGGPISDNLDYRFSFQYNRNSPWLQNTLGPSLGADNTANGRFQLLYKLTDGMQDLLEVFGSRSFPVAAGDYIPTPAAPDPADHGLSVNTSGPLFVQFCATLGFTVAQGATNCQGYFGPSRIGFQFSDPRVGNFERIIGGATNTFTDDLSWGKLTAITNYTNYGKHYEEDDSDDPIPIVGYRNDAAAYQLSQELQLNGRAGALQWVGGLYLLDIRGHYDNDTIYTNIYDPILVTGTDYIQDVTTYALYGQADYALSSRWSVTLGARVERDDKSINLTGFCAIATPALCNAYFLVPTTENVQGQSLDTQWSGNLQFQYQLSSDVMLYTGIRRGTKGAEISATTYPPPGLTFDSILVKPEILTDTEAGIKSELFDHRVRLNADIFYYDYQNYQAFKFVDFTDILFNAPARDYGSEVSATFLVTPTLTVDVGGAYLHTRVMNVELPDGTYGDQVQPLAPNLSGTLDVRKEWPVSFGTLFATGNLVYVGSRYYGSVNAPELLAPKYVLGNVGVGYNSSDEKLTCTLSVKNVGDRVITVDLFDVVSSGGYAERNLAPPRWVDFTVRYKF
ncbi:MAG TPA: TonB-dependent receptor [Steroidobacteraceae bacterium]|nr:TonB-dependent receptor [Steroidobacteraceae bacterium]